MTDRVLVGLDVGTSGTRALAVDATGRVVAEAGAAYPLLTPRPGWHEQRPDDWWVGARRVLAEVAAGRQVLGVGLTGQMHGAVFLDAADRSLRPALLWNDQRTAAEAAAITERVGTARLVEITGNPAVTGFQAPKVLWLRRHEPHLAERLRHVLLPKDYVRLQLTGERLTDASDASGTLLLDLAARDWSDELLAALDIPRALLPGVRESPEQAGRVRAEIAEEIGIAPGTPVAAGAGDNGAAAIGTGVVRRGVVSSSIGTSGVLFAHTDRLLRDPSGRLHALCHAVPGAYALMGVTLAAGASLAWWRDRLREVAPDVDFDGLVELVADAPAGAEGLLFLPYLSGERTPHLDPRARGAFFGLSAAHGLSHLTRAVMEGVALSLRDCLKLMRELRLPIEQVRAIGGGARSEVWRGLQADVYGLPIHRPVVEEGPAYGAALLAGVAAGVYRDVEEACRVVGVRPEVTAPEPVRTQLYDRAFAIYRSLYASTADAMHALETLAEPDAR
ncbi:MAG: xylulokinase [Candidatus Dormiibacterota bacterium]